MKEILNQLKEKNNIVDVAKELGYDGKQTGTCFQGNCPEHESEKQTCLNIWPSSQRFKCFHCGKAGDVINLVETYKKSDFKGAVAYLAKRAGMSVDFEKDTLTEEERESKKLELEECRLVEEMLTEAAEFYHEQLKDNPEIRDHLLNHYGFSDEIVEEYRIGYSPAELDAEKQETSGLQRHLESKANFREKLALSSLFVCKSSNGKPIQDYFKGRIIFPYWKNGKVVSMIGRSTDHTPANKYECLGNKDGNVKKDENGIPEYIKYKKLRTHDHNDKQRQYISKALNDNSLLGESCVRGAKKIIVTEGVPDFISAIDKGFAALSPATTSFREKDIKKIIELTKHANEIYIINDNEKNGAGFKGAMKTGFELMKAGLKAFIVKLPLEENKTKIDLNEYLKNHTAGDLEKLMDSSESVIDILIRSMSEDYIKATKLIGDYLAPILKTFESGVYKHYVKKIADKVKTQPKTVSDDIKAAIKKQEKQSENSQKKPNPEVLKKSEELAKDPDLLKKRIDFIGNYVVGERLNIAMIFCALDSRLIESDDVGTDVISLKISGHFGAGKSYTLINCLNIYPESCYNSITGGSAKSMYHFDGGLKHKALIINEAFQFQNGKSNDNDFAYCIRSLVSEGCLKYLSTEQNEDGGFMAKEKKLEGPTPFITTTIVEKIEAQLEDRLFTIHPDESSRQTKNILMKHCEKAAGKSKSHDKNEVEAWKIFHETLKTMEVVIPFSEKIAELFIGKNKNIPIMIRRAFKRLLSMIKAIAILYQNQRKKDDQDRLIAEIQDYWMALQIARKSIGENIGKETENTEEKLEFIKNNKNNNNNNKNNGPVKLKDFAKEFGISKSSASAWVTKRARNGLVCWCDKDGHEFENQSELKSAKCSGKAYLKAVEDDKDENDIELPSPWDLTNDPDWEEGGELCEMYDLKFSHNKHLNFDKYMNDCENENTRWME